MNKRDSTGVGYGGQRDSTLSCRAMAEPCRDKPDLHIPVASGVERSDLSPGNDDRLPCLLCAAENRQAVNPRAETVENSLCIALVQGRDEPFRPHKGVLRRIRSDDATVGARGAA